MKKSIFNLDSPHILPKIFLLFKLTKYAQISRVNYNKFKISYLKCYYKGKPKYLEFYHNNILIKLDRLKLFRQYFFCILNQEFPK